MSPLFGKSEGKVAREQAGQVEFERLTALSAADFALELMPAFGPDGPRGRGPDGGIHILQLLSWVNHAHFPRGISYVRPLEKPVREGVQALEHAGLVMITRRSEATWMSATRLGETALAEGTVQARLADPANA